MTAIGLLQRYDYIDALRGIAIILVLIAHTSLFGSNNYPTWFQHITAIEVGPRGVQLFYVVSAYTLCLSFYKRKNKEKYPIINFYIRRFFRIAPLFYVAIFYYLWQENYWNNNPMHFSFANIITTFTFVNGISPYWINNIVFGGWSIAIEMTFYLIFPLLFYMLKNIRVAIIITFFSMIIMQIFRLYLLSLPYIHNDPNIQTYTFQFFPSQLPIFLIGITLFLLIKNTFNKKSILLFMLAFCLLLLVQIIFKLKIIAGHYIYSLVFAFLLYILSKKPYKLLVNPVITHIGRVSFGIYICHVAILYWLNHFKLIDIYPASPFLNYSLRFLLLLTISTIIASILFYTIERGGQIAGKKIIDSYEKSPANDINTSLKTW